MKTLLNLVVALLISDFVFSQDTSSNQKLSEDQTYHVAPSSNANINNRNTNTSNDSKNHIYRDTRLGSSSPLYDTYKKNDYGAGAITTNPNKSGGGSYTPSATQTNQMPANGSSNNPVGSDSLNNNNGSGTITTNPNKR